MSDTTPIEVRREDGELLGYVEESPEGWRALSVFGGEIAIRPDRPAAADEVSSRGLGVLAETWWWRGEPAVLVEASPQRVVARIGGIPSLAKVGGAGGDGGEASPSPAPNSANSPSAAPGD